MTKNFPIFGDELDPLKTCNRHEVSLATSNNKVYLYGGQEWYHNGTSDPPFQVTNRFLRIVDFTSGRNLNEPSIITAEPIRPETPIMVSGPFWADDKHLYVSGGAVAGAPYLSDEAEFIEQPWLDDREELKGLFLHVYDFSTGNWTKETMLQPVDPPRAEGTFSCGAIGWNEKRKKGYFYLGKNDGGGYKTYPGEIGFKMADPDNENGTVGLRSLLTFDAGKYEWKNTSTAENPLTNSWIEQSKFVFLPGTETTEGGIAVIIGGKRMTGPQQEAIEPTKRVHVFDSATEKWYAQDTTAENDVYPKSRMGFCAVAASAPDNSSHNIYVYGGRERDSTDEGLDDFWVLSVPAFHWTKLDVQSSVPRAAAACAKVADKYMLVYGGSPVGSCEEENYGLNLFDLNTLEWTTNYEGPPRDGYAYTVPSAVYEIIGGNGTGGATKSSPSAGFSTPELGLLFNGQVSTNSTDVPAKPSTSPAPASSKTNVGAIAGGVVGGILALAILGFFIWFVRRRKSGPRHVPLENLPSYDQQQKYANFAEREDSTSAVEMPGYKNTFAQELEAPERSPSELPGSHGERFAHA